MNICERLLKMIYDEINLFKTYDNVKDIDSQYFYTLGMLDSSYNIDIVNLNDYQDLKCKLEYEYDYHKDRIGELKEIKK